MKTLALALLCLISSSAAFGSASTNKNALELIKKVQEKRASIKNKLKSQTLIKILQPDLKVRIF